MESEPRVAGTEADTSAAAISERLNRIECDLLHIAEALAQAGLKRCVWCRKFFKSADPKALFNSREVVCYRCVPEWWFHYRGQLATTERDLIEYRLIYWLIHQHDAKIVRDPAKLTGNSGNISIIASCLECRGSGIFAGSKCSRCYDGNVWVLIPRLGSPPGESGVHTNRDGAK